MKTWKMLTMLTMVLSLAFLPLGCEDNDGDFEDVGEEIDEGIDDVGDDIDDGLDEMDVDREGSFLFIIESQRTISYA